jgi:uncharacterized protein YidB (DUF937 family)
MSGLLGQLLGGMASGQSEQQPSAITGILRQVLASSEGGSGGVAGLVSQFTAAGFGQHAQSWVGAGQNMALSGEQVGQVFSPDQIDDWAQQAGTSPDKMRDVLAQALPHVVDHLTPGGQVPTQAPDLSAIVGRLFGPAAR